MQVCFLHTLFLEYATETRGNKCKAVFYRYKRIGMRSLELFWPFSILAKNLGDVLALSLSIKPKLVKRHQEYLQSLLLCVFLAMCNICILGWKAAPVTLLHKSGSHCDPNNLRAISVLLVVMKIFERTIHKQLYNHLVKNTVEPLLSGLVRTSVNSPDNRESG